MLIKGQLLTHLTILAFSQSVRIDLEIFQDEKNVSLTYK